MCSYAPAEVIGKPFLDFVDESDRAADGRGVCEADRPRKTANHVPEREAGLRRKDGAIIDVLAHGSLASYEGRPAVMGVLLDVSERKRAETALREEEAKFRGLVEQEIAGVVIVREDGTLAYVNPQFAKMVGCAPGELIGRPLLEVVPPGEQETVRETIRRQLAGGGGFAQLASRLATRNGGTLDILINASHSVYEGRPASIAVVLDISDRRRAERSLERPEPRR